MTAWNKEHRFYRIRPGKSLSQQTTAAAATTPTNLEEGNLITIVDTLYYLKFASFDKML